MARGYSVHDMRSRIIEALGETDSTKTGGMSGTEIARSLGISRITMSKYLGMLAGDGTLAKRDMGNVTLWSLQSEQESLEFPDDYFKAASAYIECIKNTSEAGAMQVVRNCTRSGASLTRLVLDVVIPASDAIHDMYNAGKIGDAEQNFLGSIILRSLYTIESNQSKERKNQKKNMFVIAADARNEHASRAVCSIFRLRGWTVFELGDMSANARVLFDIDFQRLTDKVWKKRQEPLVTVVLSSTAEGLNFFADSLYPITKKSRRMHLLLCGRGLDEPVSNIKSCDYYIDGDITKIVQISDSV